MGWVVVARCPLFPWPFLTLTLPSQLDLGYAPLNVLYPLYPRFGGRQGLFTYRENTLPVLTTRPTRQFAIADAIMTSFGTRTE